MQILWAVREGNEAWREEIITTDETKIDAARKWAEANGFRNFRISEMSENERPDFTKVLNTNRTKRG